MDDLSSTTGIVALIAAVAGARRAHRGAVLLRALRRLRADQRAILGGSTPQDLVAHAAELDRGFGALNDYVEDVALASTRGWPPPRAASTARSPSTALVRYDAYNEMSGRQSTSIALLDATRSGIVHVLDPPPRPGAPLRQAGARAARAELELSPEEEEAMRAGAGGRGARASERRAAPPTLMRVGYLGPPGTFSEEALLPGRRRDGAEPVPARAPSTRRSMAVDGGGVDRALVPDRELAGGRRSTRRSTRWPWDARDLVIVGEVRARRSATASSPARRRARRDRGRSSRIRRRWRSARASCAASCRGAAVRAAGARPPTRCAGDVAEATSGGRRSAPRLRRGAVRGAACCATEVEDQPGNETRFVWLGAAGQRRARAATAGAGRRRSSSGAPATPQPGWLVRCLSEFAFRGVNLTQDRVAPPARWASGHYMFFVDMEGRADERVGAPRRCSALEVHCEGSAHAGHLSGGLSHA